MFRSRILRVALVLGMLVIPLISTSTNVNAQAYRGLIIDEFKYDLGLVEPGQIIKKSFTVTHDYQDNNKKVTVYLNSKDFTSNGTDGTPVFLKKGALNEMASLSSWISFDTPTITLTHYKQKEIVNFTITIPQNAEPGGKYAAVLISDTQGESELSGNSTEDSKLGLNKELGPLVLLTVKGDLTYGVIGEDLYTQNIFGQKTNFFFNPPVNAVAVLKNSGNVYAIPRGKIYIYRGDDFQNYEAAFELNDKSGVILGNSSRTFENEWNDSFIYDAPKLDKDGKEQLDAKGNVVTEMKIDWAKLGKLRIGKYNVKMLYLSPDASGSGKTLEMNTSFWVIPWQLILLVLILIAIIVVSIILKRAGKKKIKSSRYEA